LTLQGLFSIPFRKALVAFAKVQVSWRRMPYESSHFLRRERHSARRQATA
jgi:hypothetical protein